MFLKKVVLRKTFIFSPVDVTVHVKMRNDMNFFEHVSKTQTQVEEKEENFTDQDCSELNYHYNKLPSLAKPLMVRQKSIVDNTVL